MKLCYNVLFFLLLIGREIVGTVTLKQVYEIAKIKKQDSSMKNVSLQSLCKSIVGTSRGMGIKIVPGRDADMWRFACVSLLHKWTYFGLSRNRSLIFFKTCHTISWITAWVLQTQSVRWQYHVDGPRAQKERLASRNLWKWMKNLDCRAEFQFLTPIAHLKNITKDGFGIIKDFSFQELVQCLFLLQDMWSGNRQFTLKQNWIIAAFFIAHS